MTCKTCAKKYLCKDYAHLCDKYNSKEQQKCDKYEKEPYTTIVEKENGIKEIRRID